MQNYAFSGGEDACGVPANWIARIAVNGTAQPYLGPAMNPEAPYIIEVFDGEDDRFPYTAYNEGNPKKPCGRVMLATAMTALWADGGLAQIIDVTPYVGQNLDILWMCKGDISVNSYSTGGDNPMPVNAFYEPRFSCQDISYPATTGIMGDYPFREEQRGLGIKQWDWKLFTYSMPITKNYLHMFHDLSGTKDPAPWRQLLIDRVVVKTPGSIIPISDLNEDNEIDFNDLYILMDNWLEGTVLEPPWVY